MTYFLNEVFKARIGAFTYRSTSFMSEVLRGSEIDSIPIEVLSSCFNTKEELDLTTKIFWLEDGNYFESIWESYEAYLSSTW